MVRIQKRRKGRRWEVVCGSGEAFSKENLDRGQRKGPRACAHKGRPGGHRSPGTAKPGEGNSSLSLLSPLQG